MNHARQGSALLLILAMMSILTIIGLVVHNMAWRVSTLARDRTLHMQRYYTTRALLELAEAQGLEVETEISPIPFEKNKVYRGKIIVQKNDTGKNIVTAQLYSDNIIVYSLSR